MKRLLQTFGLMILSVFTVANSNAQIIEKKSLTLEGARQVISAAKDYARKNLEKKTIVGFFCGAGIKKLFGPANLSW